MSTQPTIVVLHGGTSTEREVSLVSGRAVAEALARSFPVELVELTADRLPAGLDPARQVIFPALHGGYGEGGGLQADLERAGFAYAGCDARASRLCMEKQRCKDAAAAAGVPVAPSLRFAADRKPEAAQLMAAVGNELVLKPDDQGSSVGLIFAAGEAEIEAALVRLTAGVWIAERRLSGEDHTVGLLDGAAMGIIGIRPAGGVYDYTHKYTAGKTTYLVPAPLPEGLAQRLRVAAEAAFRACGCRDFSRVDFMVDVAADTFAFLEVNTIPGLTSTSLLPKSASCVGLDFTALARRMVEPALARHAATRR